MHKRLIVAVAFTAGALAAQAPRWLPKPWFAAARFGSFWASSRAS